MTGFLVQWPTLITLMLYPVMLISYVRLAINEERETRARFGAVYERYMAAVPRFLPRRRRTQAVAS
jgi:protein-S-isoprenylcysteine O-methyltransferase Ste14